MQCYRHCQAHRFIAKNLKLYLQIELSKQGKVFSALTGEVPVMGNGINLSDTVVKAHRINITAISLEKSIAS